MKEDVEQAVKSLIAHFGGAVSATDLGDGGASVIVGGISLAGGPYHQSETWCGFTITYAHPYADIYPHFVRHDLSRKDGQAFGLAINANNNFYGQPAIMLSRRAKLVSPDLVVNPILKLEKVITWLVTR